MEPDLPAGLCAFGDFDIAGHRRRIAFFLQNNDAQFVFSRRDGGVKTIGADGVVGLSAVGAQGIADFSAVEEDFRLAAQALKLDVFIRLCAGEAGGVFLLLRGSEVGAESGDNAEIVLKAAYPVFSLFRFQTSLRPRRL